MQALCSQRTLLRPGARSGCRQTCKARCVAASRSRSRNVAVYAFKETDDIKDWRIKDMVTKTHRYFEQIWSKGNWEAADELLDPNFVHRDMCGGWVHPSDEEGAGAHTGVVVGPKAFKAVVEGMRRQYPDFYIEIEQVGVSDTSSLFVLWVSHGTQLEAEDDKHTASYHNSLTSGVNLVRFTPDRSKILEVNVYRQLTQDERKEVERRNKGSNQLEIHLARLHWEPAGPEPPKGAAGGKGKPAGKR